MGSYEEQDERRGRQIERGSELFGQGRAPAQKYAERGRGHERSGQAHGRRAKCNTGLEGGTPGRPALSDEAPDPESRGGRSSREARRPRPPACRRGIVAPTSPRSSGRTTPSRRRPPGRRIPRPIPRSKAPPVAHKDRIKMVRLMSVSGRYPPARSACEGATVPAWLARPALEPGETQPSRLHRGSRLVVRGALPVRRRCGPTPRRTYRGRRRTAPGARGRSWASAPSRGSCTR